VNSRANIRTIITILKILKNMKEYLWEYEETEGIVLNKNNRLKSRFALDRETLLKFILQ